MSISEIETSTSGSCPANGAAVGPRYQRNKAETDSEIGVARLRKLKPYALARMGLDFEVEDPSTGTLVKQTGSLPLRKDIRRLAEQLTCGTDLIYELVDRICKIGPENVRGTDMLKKAQGGGKGSSRLEPSLSKALDAAVWEICVEQGACPGRSKTNKAIRSYMIAQGCKGQLPTTATINIRSKSTKIVQARTDAYSRDHLNRICGQPDEIRGLMSLVQLDTTQFTCEDYKLLVVDAQGRNMGPANVIFGVLGSNRGVWTWLPFAGAPNGFLTGLAIHRGLLSKEALLNRWGIAGIFPFHGKPGGIQHDGGSEFVNDHSVRVMKDWDIAVNDRSPPATPHYRGTLERFNRTAHLLFGEFLESSVGKRYVRPVRGDAKARGILLEDLDRALAEWIVSHYHVRPHKGLGGDSPISRYEKLVLGGDGVPASGIPSPLQETREMTWEFLWEEARVVNHLGIELFNRRYSCPELNSLFATGLRSSKRRIPFRFNPYSMKVVHVRIPIDGGGYTILDVPWIPENGKFIMSDTDRGSCLNPTLWEWEALYKDIRRATGEQPAASVVEELHQKRIAAVAEAQQKGAPSGKTKIKDARNSGMGEHYGKITSPTPNSETAGSAPKSDGNFSENTTATKPDKHRPKYKPMYLAVGAGADAY